MFQSSREMRIIELILMKTKKNASLSKEQVGIIEIPFWMFGMVLWDKRMLNRVIVGDCCWECFWCGIERGEGRHNGKDEGLKMETLLFFIKFASLNKLFLSVSSRYFISVIGCR